MALNGFASFLEMRMKIVCIAVALKASSFETDLGEEKQDTEKKQVLWQETENLFSTIGGYVCKYGESLFSRIIVNA